MYMNQLEGRKNNIKRLLYIANVRSNILSKGSPSERNVNGLSSSLGLFLSILSDNWAFA